MTVENVLGHDVTCVWADKGRLRREVLKDFMLRNGTAGSDMVLIIEGVNASPQDIETYHALGEAFGNA